MKKLLALTSLIFTVLCLSAQTDNQFDKLFAQAQAFAKSFPREKVHLHFDNTSYYQGDTIWFKAYVVTADDNKPSAISRPLYVDMLDQLGNVVDRQIVKITDGEGEGFFSLVGQFFTGYYEIRAYTKWMLATENAQYFSQTLPIYRKRINNDEPRSIAHYHMDKSMKQRPTEKIKKINARFFPEGGRLVKGVASVVGIETVSENFGWVNVEGYLLNEEGQRALPVSTIHDGMGSFIYTPGENPAQVEIIFNEKSYKFTLPEADAEGYTMSANMRADNVDIIASRSSSALTTPLALFVFQQGMPLTYVPVEWNGNSSKHIRIPFSAMPSGVIRLALIDAEGNTLADRFCFVPLQQQPVISAKTDAPLYEPFQKVECRLKVTDSEGRPASGTNVSVAIRNGGETDYRLNDHTIMTDLLLTSELKGYINQPGFYFEENSTSRRRLLDNLMLIRGWRRYDLKTEFGLATFKPRYLPETNLTLYGHVKAFLRGTQRDLGITILAQNDSMQLSGTTVTDSLGNFSVPIDDFEGTMETLIQTRKAGKVNNRATDVLLYRQLEPETRMLDFSETNPLWDSPVDTLALNKALDEETTYVPEEDVKLVDEVVVKAKRKKNFAMQRTEDFERDIIAFYNIRQALSDLRDEGKEVANDFGYLLHTLNPNVDRAGDNYNTTQMRYSIGGRTMERFFFNTYIDAIETAMLFTERSGRQTYQFDPDTYRAVKTKAQSYWDDTYSQSANPENDSISLEQLSAPIVRCDVTMKKRFDPNKNYRPTKGLRYTTITGYTRPEAFYSPQYPTEIPPEAYEDNRRTLYWNPTMTTDSNGEIVVNCYLGYTPAFLNVNAETIVDGKPAAVTYISFGQ